MQRKDLRCITMSMAEVIKSIEREALREAQSREIGSRITVCINGQLITYEGNVEFIFVENENKIKVTEKPNIVHSDKVIVYIPKDSVEYLGIVGIGK